MCRLCVYAAKANGICAFDLVEGAVHVVQWRNILRFFLSQNLI